MASNVLRLRIVKVDHYLYEEPIEGLDQLYSDFKGCEITLAPVIRIFGVTETGQKGCLHVHGYKPYIYVSFEAQRYIDKQAYIQRLAQELDQHLVRRKDFDGVIQVAIVKGKPFYGFHSSEKQFLKIDFLNPYHIRKATDLCQRGSIMGGELAVHEGHIPYILKFFIDYNLFGMNFINIENPLYRYQSSKPGVHNSDNLNLQQSLIKKMTVCEIEADCKVDNILNVKETCVGIESNPGLRLIWEEERQRRREYGMSIDIMPSLSQERTYYYSLENEKNFISNLKACIQNKTRNSNRNVDSTQSTRSTSQQSNNSFQPIPPSVPAPAPYIEEDDSENDDKEDDIAAEMSQSFQDIFLAQSYNPHNPHQEPFHQENLPQPLQEPYHHIDPPQQLQEHYHQEEAPQQPQQPEEPLQQVQSPVPQCDCEIDECCDFCCDFESESADTDSSRAQDSRIPQLDGSFDEIAKKKANRAKVRFNPLPVRVTKYMRSNKNDSGTLKSELSDDRSGKEIEKSDLDIRKKNGFAVLDQMVRELKNAKPRVAIDYSSSESQDSTNSAATIPSSASSSSLHAEERVFRHISGHKLLVLKSIDENLIKKIGRESVKIEEIDQKLLAMLPRRIKRLVLPSTQSSQSSTPCMKVTSSLPHSLGKNKLDYLLSLCKPLTVYIDKASTINESDLSDLIGSQDSALQSQRTSKKAKLSEIKPIKSPKKRFTKSSKNSPSKSAPLKNSSKPKSQKNKNEQDKRRNKENKVGQIYVHDDSGSLTECNGGDSTDTEVLCFSDNERDIVKNSESMNDLNKYVESQIPLNNLDKGLKDLEKFCQEHPIEEIPSQTSFTSSVGAYSFENTSESHHNSILNRSDSLSPSHNRSFNLLSQSFAPPLENNKHSTPQVKRKRGRPRKNVNTALPNSSHLDVIPEKEEVSSSSRMTRSTTETEKLKAFQRLRSGSVNDSNKSKQDKTNKRQSLDSILDGVTGENTYNFVFNSFNNNASNDKQGSTKYSVHEYQFITCMSLEVLATTEKDKAPDPRVNSIRAIFYGIMNDVPADSSIKQIILGMIVVDTDVQELAGCSDSILLPLRRKLLARSGFNSETIQVIYATDEYDMLAKLVAVVKEHNPDIMLGYEIERNSWAYVLQRAEALNVSIKSAISRVLDDKYAKCTSEYDLEFRVGIEMSGRIILNLWRIIRRELKLTMYTYENVHYHVLHQRVPAYTQSQLSDWFECDSNINRWRVIDHYLTRVEGCLKIIDKMDIISLTSELARLFGIQFYEVFSRGSQFRVESMMFRCAKPLNYIIFSPSPLQRQRMRYIECLPLIMEPEANFYSDPVVVLDFQSLYPSIMIAYNYCYSTCLGYVENIVREEQFEFGCSSLYLPTHIIKQHINDIHVSPCGVAFLKPHIRRGVVPQMLEEILTSRLMVKNSIKVNHRRPQPSKSLHKLLHARQMGLKLISNVTYGYTSANYSGRMPSVEIADSIVSKGREILERSIELIENNSSWGGKVVYGDTDSLFILFPGLSKAEAFSRGQEIVLQITKDNPYPVKLKFEKVYQPCVLQTKKRYIGYMWETLEQKEGILEAKGNEVIRRDFCPAAKKILEKAVKLLFTTQDVENHVKPYVQRQFNKILRGRISNLSDFIFAREYRGSERYTPNACVPSLKIAQKIKETNPRGEPLRKERVPYIIVFGTPEQPLIQLVKQPLDLIKDPSLRLNGTYYIERIIVPTLNRVFSMMGFDVMQWYAEVPRMNTYQRSIYLHAQAGTSSRPTTLLQYFAPGMCPVCGQKAPNDDICSTCLTFPLYSAVSLTEEIRSIEKRFHAIVSICKSCTGSNDIEQNCVSVECPQLYRYSQSKLDIHNVNYLSKLLEKLKVASNQQF